MRVFFLAAAAIVPAACSDSVQPGDKLAFAEGWTLRCKGEAATYEATVPSTVAGVLYDNGVYTEAIFKDDTYRSLDRSPFDKEWTYSKQFPYKGARGSHAFLLLDGINFYADILLNGQPLRSRDTTFGVFNRYCIDVTDCLKSSNNLKIRLTRAQRGDLNVGYVDWNPRPLDESMGVWRDVTLAITGDIRMSDPFVKPVVAEDLSSADLCLSATLTNLSDKPVESRFKGSFEDGTFEIPVTLAPYECREVTVSPKEAPQLHLDNPRLWWCSGLGNPELYHLTIEVLTKDGKVSDADKLTFGVRNITSYIDAHGYRQFVLNGKKVLLKGAGWTDDIFMRDTHESIERQVQYVKDMNLNLIRFENIWGKDRYVYDMCDKYGILALVGWSCQWEWEDYCGLPETDLFGCIATPETMDLAASYFENQVKWLRNNVSVIGWMTGSDRLPHPDLEPRYLEMYEKLDYRPYIGSAKNLTSVLSGPSGTKMEGPYEYVGPDYWYLDTDLGGAFGFNTETGIGANLPVVSSLRRMVSEDKLWPLGKALGAHATSSGSAMNNTRSLEETIAGLYGEAKDLDDFVRKGHAVDYDGTRAMFEAFRVNLPATTGIVQWMLNSAWPSIYWQLYDWYLVPTAGYYGTRKACAPVQLIYNIKDARVYAVNETPGSVEVTASFDLLNAGSKGVASGSKTLTVKEREPLPVFDLSKYKGKELFLSLRLTDASGKALADNFYCLPARWNTYAWKKANWYVTPITRYADFRFVTQLPPAKVRCDVAADGDTYTVTVTNDSDVVAYQNILTLKDTSGNLIVPAFWSDNYFSLLPHETKVITCRTETPGQIELTNWNH
ncbi:MAG: glycoside hydrolase family 2 [Bacteroidales bacterium]|nr:glycoside hydrolase family 2 [Bacteroidales bacterium]